MNYGKQGFQEGVPQYVPRSEESQDADTVILDPHENMDPDNLEDKAESS